MNAEHKRLIQRWSREVWNERRFEMIDEMMAPDCVIHVEGVDHPLSRDDFREYNRIFLAAVPDLLVEQLSITTEGDTSFLVWRATGTHTGHGLGIPPSGRPLHFAGVSLFQIRDGWIVRGSDCWNRGDVIASLMEIRMDELCERTGLTIREAEVALMMADRFNFREIAERLRIRPNTARRHCERVLSKLGVHRRQDVAQALGKIPGSVLARHGEDLAPRAESTHSDESST